MKILNFMGSHFKFRFRFAQPENPPLCDAEFPSKIKQNSKFSKNKKGMLLASETLKIVLAVISIGFLIYLLAAIYFNSGDTKDLKKAEATMERIDLILDRLGETNFSGETVTEISPAGWKIFSFTEAEVKPNSCSGENCLCICEDTLIDNWDRQVQRCDDLGVCSVVPNLMEFQDIEIEKADNPTSIFIEERGNWVEVTEI